MATKLIRLKINLPNGVVASPELEKVADEAANKAITEHLRKFTAVRDLALRLNREGFDITAEELLERRKPAAAKATKAAAGKKAKFLKVPSADRPKRVVLTDGQRASVIEALKNGEKTKSLSEKYGVSPATIANIKRDNGLTKPRK